MIFGSIKKYQKMPLLKNQKTGSTLFILVCILFIASACAKEASKKNPKAETPDSTVTNVTTTTLPAPNSELEKQIVPPTPDTNENKDNSTNTNPGAIIDDKNPNKPLTGTTPAPNPSKKPSTLPVTIKTQDGTLTFETQEEKMDRICRLEFRSIDEFNETKNAACLKDLNPENAYRLTQLMRARFSEVQSKLKEHDGKVGAVTISIARDTFWWIVYGSMLPGGTLATAKTTAAAAKALEKWNSQKNRVKELTKWAERQKFINKHYIGWFKSTSVIVVLTGIASAVSEHKDELINLVLNTPEEIQAAKIIFEFLKEEAIHRSIVLETFYLTSETNPFLDGEKIQ